MSINVEAELRFNTSRSGGKGGQNVNKVETQVEARWHLRSSQLLDEEQKQLLEKRLENKLNNKGELIVKCNEDRSQLGNKEKAIKKLNAVLNKALIQQKKRKKTAIPKAVKEKIKKAKQANKEKKALRRKVDF